LQELNLNTILNKYFSENDIIKINQLCSKTDFEDILAFDRLIGGIGIFNINIGRTGRYNVEDRDVLRPLQYIYMNLNIHQDSLSWYTRDIIHMCGLHLESIVKRITKKNRVPLGKSLFDGKLKSIIDSELLSDIKIIAVLFNAAKHEVSRNKDEHLFSIEDALLCYFITRKLADNLYPYIKLYTNPEVWKD
jgi:hypothetical protein